MQPLDVGGFSTWKHYQSVAVNNALSHFDFVYDVSSFFHDLTFIRNKTFTDGLVRYAFRESRMVPPNAEKVKSNMRKYYKPITAIKTPVDDLGIQLPSISRIDQSL
jgi:hypothetical protein